ncbi:MAG: 7-cyano-7-deazaguanine synthase [Pseudomonadota bacterium]
MKGSLARALKMLTGDDWDFSFVPTPEPQSGPVQSHFGFPEDVDTVIPFSDGLDSRAVSTVLEGTRSENMIRVRVGSKKIVRPGIGEPIQPFANVPFKVSRIKSGNGESSGRSRGFKFAMLSGIAAYLVGADRIIVPESGQGALGPVLVNLGQSCFDRRTHPQYTSLMSEFFKALFGTWIEFEHPVLWKTKGESLAAYKAMVEGDEIWKETRSCWKDARHASVNGDHRQCGVCAACMLRRTSLHAAGYAEDPSMYIWEDLSASDFWAGAHKDHHDKSIAQRDYAVAGVLHMDHIAALAVAEDREVLLQRQALVLARTLEVSFHDSERRLARLIEKHADEWQSFVASLSKSSFVRDWALAA